MEWENTKENCVPVRAGRSKAALQELADPAAEALEAKRKELWTQVTEYQGDDPLEAWQKYIKWMQEYGVGGGKADLQKVLEACTKELQKLPRYKNDIRFLRIWIQYADCLPDPGDVFLYLREKDIGRDFALYYEAYATYFELRANFQSADAVYMDGVQRGAKPLERLKQKHTAFQQRMAHRIKRRIQDEQELGPPPAEPVRTSLAAIGGRPAGPRAAQQLQQQHGTTLGGVFGAPSAGHAPLFGGPPLPPAQVAPQRAARPLVVVADAEFMGLGLGGGSENGPLPGYSTMPQMNNLKELKPYTVIRKENTDRATAWNQFSLLPGGAPGPGGGGGGGASNLGLGGPGAGSASAAGLDIFTDEEFQEGDEPRGGGGGGVAGGALAAGASTEGAGASAAMHPLLAPSNSAAGASFDPLLSSLAPPPALLRGSQPAALAALSLATPTAPAATRGAGLVASTTVGLAGPGKLAPALQAAGGSKPLLQPGAPAPTTAQPGPGLSVSGAAAQPISCSANVPGPPPLHPVAAAALAVGRDVEPCHFSYLALQDGSAQEMSYEELRAQAWMRRNPPHKRPQPAACGPATTTAAATAAPGPASTRGAEAPALVPSLAAAQRGMAGLVIPDDDDENAPAAKTAAAAGAVPTRGGLGASSRRAFGQVLSAGGGGATALGSAGASSGGVAGVGGAFSVLADDDEENAGGSAAAASLLHAPVADDNPLPQRRLPTESGAGAAGSAPTAAPLAATASSRRAALGVLHDGGTAESSMAAFEPPPPALPARPLASDAVPALEPHGAQPTGPRPEPTVTISTRGAFDLLNSMFSDDLPHQQQRQPQQPQPQARPMPLQARAPQPGLGAPLEAASTLGIAAVHASAPAVPAPAVPVAAAPTAAPGAAAAAAAHEPTVTLHTRLAFDAINDMFSDALPHEEARRSRRTSAAEGGGATTKRITSSDVRRLANAGRAGSATAPHAPAPAFPVAPVCPSGAASSLAIHEDTFFLGPAAAAAATAAQRGPAPCGHAVGAGTAASAGAGGCQPVAHIYEDTEYVGLRTGVASAAAAGQGVGPGLVGGGGVGGSSAAGGTGLMGALICEDTEFITKPVAAAASAAPVALGAIGGLGFAGRMGTLGAAAAPAAPGRHTAGTSLGTRPAGLGGGRPSLGADAVRQAPYAAGTGRGTGQGGGGGGLQIREDTQFIGGDRQC
ncbi:hypothetical protein HYH02_011323 [Chlamydomonas schloesseri]|uniref:BUB1 N-terminal domain-containing protein n=1 Tax=Chlamydomonas schloesseri TaxID=2026947 RepID=A0A835T1F1_9CHLO|nr:hypothetical protein HYH02_011323 [Chlamydomonas schloesseri]|eukprot:KAG2437063.1 hypothetical protein HYH02_011323 [Chlamydomonas schloesseri]